MNKNRIAELKTNYFHPEFALTLPDNRFEQGRYTINEITIVSNSATFVPIESIPLNEQLIHTQKTVLRAGETDQNKAMSGSFSYTVTDTFSFKFGQKIRVKAGFKIEALASFEITGELNAEETWTKTKTWTITAPSQGVKVKAHHRKEVTFSVFKGTSINKGVLKTKIDPNLKINTFFTRTYSINNFYQRFLKLSDLIEEVKRIEGNGNLFTPNSMITKEGNDLFLNIPCEVQSDSSRLDVSFGNETPLR